ncbi:MAG: hypothetical protein QXH42_02340 [Thermoplasmata archaeon]
MVREGVECPFATGPPLKTGAFSMKRPFLRNQRLVSGWRSRVGDWSVAVHEVRGPAFRGVGRRATSSSPGTESRCR